MGEKATDVFFDVKKKPWSKIKDDILRCYLRPYANKLYHTGLPLVYIDGFSGAGLYEGMKMPPGFAIEGDGIPDHLGSPFIALKTLEWAKAESSFTGKFHAFFIEKYYADRLRQALDASCFRPQDYQVIKGDFTEMLPQTLDRVDNMFPRGYNMFCYIDPYGIKTLKMDLLGQAIKHREHTVEFLINFNSFGVLRAGMATLKKESHRAELLAMTKDMDYELMEKELNGTTPGANKELFNQVFGTDEWMEVIKDYDKDNIDGYKAEERLSELYKKRLQENLGFKYVMDLPIRFSEGMKHPKYRMVHATNHLDGINLMADVMRKRKLSIYKMQQGDQLDLFDFQDESADIKTKILGLLSSQEVRLEELQANFYMNYGVPSKTFTNLLKELESQEKIIVRRDPPPKSKRLYYTEDKEKQIFIKKADSVILK